MDESKVAAALARMESMGGDIAEIKGAITRLSEAVVTLARVEERQGQDRTNILRLFTVTDDLTVRVGTLEKAQPMTQQTNRWVQYVIALAITAILTAVISTSLAHAGRESRIEVPAPELPVK